MSGQDHLIARFAAREAHVAVIGLGYVGLPLAVAFAEAGYRVTGIDLDARKVDAINRGESYIEDVPSAALAALVKTGRKTGGKERERRGKEEKGASVPATSSPHHPAALSAGSLFATTDYSALATCDAASICVPTPLNKTGDPDISYIINATEQIARYLHPDMVIVLESTTYPGTTTEVMLPILRRGEGRGARDETQEGAEGAEWQVGVNFFLAFSPERVDPGRTDWTTRNTPKVMGGVTPACGAVASAFYAAAIDTLAPVSSPEAAEMVKLFENTFRSVNIGLANELLLMCDKLGLDAWEIIEAAATKPFGFMKFTPGPGLGGHCIPIDPLYLSWKMRTVKYHARFIELASEINTEMPRYWVQKVQDALNDAGKAVKGSRVLVLGVAYKKNVSDLRESPALDIIRLLEQKGAHVAYHDPHVPTFEHEGMAMRSVGSLDIALAEADCVVIATDHAAYDWAAIRQGARLLVDTRHVATG
ncbi:MAG: nucleotide sugar dehydrogenase [Caldilineaceae bacterium]|nr:nucleotide sugar dehydrogenase [Caldilineaceae bacterium]